MLSLLDSVPPGPRPLDLRDRTLLELLASSGLRASEAASLRVHDLDFHRMEIRLVGKGGRARLAFFTERCAHYVRLYLVEARPLLADPGQDLLFVTRRGGRLSGPQMWSIVAKWAKKAGLECSPHVLRHSLATALLERGVNLRYIQEILGHARLATTEIYTRVRPDKLSSVYQETVPFK